MKNFHCIQSINDKVQKGFKFLFVFLFFIFLFSGTPIYSKGIVNHNAIKTSTNTTFPIGVYIIDMGQTTQTYNNGLKPYGLVYALINAGIPVNWAINPAKAKDGTDFIASSAGNLNKAYKGGSFIVDVVAYPIALAIINSWKTTNAGLVVDGPTTAGFTAPIYETLTIWPNAFLDEENDKKITPYYANAGIPSSTYQINANPTYLPQCGSASGTQDVYILPHADPQDWDSTWISYLQNFINNGGAMWAGCHAVSAMENISGCNFLSSTGLVLWTDHDAGNASKVGTPPFTYTSPTYPIMQIIGTLDNAPANGSESIYLPKTSWLPTTTVAVYDPDYVNQEPNPDVSYTYPNAASVIVYGPAYGTKGLIMYQGGHTIENGTTQEKVAAQRAFFNFLLLAGCQPQNSLSPPIVSNQTTTTCNGVAFNLTPTGIPANITYTWETPTGTGFLGGSAQNTPQSSISQTLTNTTTNPVIATYIVTPRNGNCTGNPFTLTVTVYPATNMTAISPLSSICLGNSTTLTASGAASYIWSPATGLSTTTGAVVVATPTVTTTYTVTEPGSTIYGCTNSKSITITVITVAIIASATPNPICTGSTLNLTSSIALGNSSGTLISEGFNGSTNNWTTTNTSTGGATAEATWALRPDDYKIDCSGDKTKLSSNDNSQFYLSNSCEQGNGGVTQTVLQSPSMNTLGFTTLSLNFYHYFKFFTGASAKVEVSTNGTSWVPVANFNSVTIGTGNNFALQNINLTPYIGYATFFIRFKYDAPWSWYWAIDNVTVSGTTNSPISWTSPNGFTSVEQNPNITNVTTANAGVYTLNYTDPAGCTATGSVTVLVNSLPTVNVSASPTSVCIGGSTTITAIGALTYSWTPSTGLSATAGAVISADPITTTTYTVTGTDVNGCRNTKDIDIIVKALPTISITPASALICTSIGTPLTASGAGSYIWSPATGLSATAGATVTAKPSVDTTYMVTGTTNGCSNTETVFVAVIPSPPTTGVTICRGGTGSLTSSATCPPGNSITTGLSNAGTGTDLTAGAGTLAWTNSGNAISSNSNFATVAINGPGLQSSQYLRTTNYGFSIPLNATIIGIAVTIGRYSSDFKGGTDIKDLEVNLLKAGAIYGSNYADTSIEWPKGPSVTAKNYGGNIDTWGVTWTPTDINDTNFGVSLRANSDNDRTASVDYMRISVTYTIPGVLNWYTTVTGGAPIGSGTPFNPVGVANSGLSNTNTPGTYTFYAECSSDTRCRTATDFIINPNSSIVSVTGASPLCIGSTATFSANTVVLSEGTGAWSSSNSAIATVNSSTGVVTAVASGATDIIYTITEGCGGTTSKQQSVTVTLVDNTLTGFSSSSFCIGNQATITFDANNLSGKLPYTVLYRNDTTLATYPVTITTDDPTIINLIPNPTVTTDYTLLSITDDNGCVNTSPSDLTARVTIVPLPATPAITASGSTTFCSGGSVTLTSSVGIGYLWSTGATTPSITPTSAGSYSLQVTSSNGCLSPASSTTVVSVNTLPNSPSVTTNQPTCSTTTGTITISAVVGETYSFNDGTYSGTLVYSGLVQGTAHTIFAKNSASGCISVASSSVTISPLVTNTWANAAWSTGSAPTINTLVVINSDYNTSTNGNLIACSVIINAGKKLTITADNYATIQNDLTVNGTLEVLDKGSLIMINDAGTVTNNGATRVYKFTSPFEKYDYVYWSTPVVSTNIASTFSRWRTNYAYEFLPANFADANGDGFDDDGNDWSYASTMLPGRGYIIMTPTNLANYNNAVEEVIFSGEVKNGVVTIPIALTPNGVSDDDFNLVGNPYPSAISADAFINANISTNNGLYNTIDGTLYFWTHIGDISSANVGPDGLNFSSDDYAVYTLAGGVGTSGNIIGGVSQGSNKPTGYIASGQGFFIEADRVGTLLFNNAMRVGTETKNNQFYKLQSNNKKSTTTVKDRLWLNLQNDAKMFSQQLIGYFDNATLGFDKGYDGLFSDAGNYVNFYSFIDNDTYKIQGRSSFDKNDQVRLGYFSAVAGTFNINIDSKEGVFANTNQAIYLEDKVSNTIFDLKTGSYTFTTAKGTFNDRFVLRYTDNALGITDFEKTENQVVVSIQNEQIKITSSAEKIDQVVVYDLSGKQRYQKRKVGSNELLLTSLAPSQQMVLVKTVLHNGKSSTIKVLY